MRPKSSQGRLENSGIHQNMTVIWSASGALYTPHMGFIRAKPFVHDWQIVHCMYQSPVAENIGRFLEKPSCWPQTACRTSAIGPCTIGVYLTSRIPQVHRLLSRKHQRSGDPAKYPWKTVRHIIMTIRTVCVRRWWAYTDDRAC